MPKGVGPSFFAQIVNYKTQKTNFYKSDTEIIDSSPEMDYAKYYKRKGSCER